MTQPLSATPDEVLAVIQELYPTQFDRAVAELTIRKQREHIDALENALAEAEAHNGHTHDED
ncbi:hypothetical protein ACPCIZ_12880 [Streptomyces cellulosae]